MQRSKTKKKKERKKTHSKTPVPNWIKQSYLLHFKPTNSSSIQTRSSPSPLSSSPISLPSTSPLQTAPSHFLHHISVHSVFNSLSSTTHPPSHQHSHRSSFPRSSSLFCTPPTTPSTSTSLRPIPPPFNPTSHRHTHLLLPTLSSISISSTQHPPRLRPLFYTNSHRHSPHHRAPPRPTTINHPSHLHNSNPFLFTPVAAPPLFFLSPLHAITQRIKQQRSNEFSANIKQNDQNEIRQNKKKTGKKRNKIKKKTKTRRK